MDREFWGPAEKLLADTGLNRLANDEIDDMDDLRSSREDRWESSVEGGCDTERELDENLLRAVDILCVSIAAGGFLLKRFPTFAATFCFSSSFFSCFSRSFFSFSTLFFSFFVLLPPNSDQLGDWQISASGDPPLADSLSRFCEDDLSFSRGGILMDNDGIVCDLCCNGGREGEAGSSGGRRNVPWSGLLSTEVHAGIVVPLSVWETG